MISLRERIPKNAPLFVIETGRAQTPALNRMKPDLSLRDILCIDLGKMDVNVRHVKTEEYEGYILERKNKPNPLTMYTDKHGNDGLAQMI